MPLFHTGGIVRNLLSPILAGGATILAPGVDAAIFWDAAPRLRVTWCETHHSTAVITSVKIPLSDLERAAVVSGEGPCRVYCAGEWI